MHLLITVFVIHTSNLIYQNLQFTSFQLYKTAHKQKRIRLSQNTCMYPSVDRRRPPFMPPPPPYVNWPGVIGGDYDKDPAFGGRYNLFYQNTQCNIIIHFHKLRLQSLRHTQHLR